MILARGLSLRMGRPKGLCRLPEDALCFLDRILLLYRQAGMPVAVVTTSILVQGYRAGLSVAPPALWVVRAGGGGTAGSVAAAWQQLAARASHLWLHPVDLPRVRAATIAELRRRSRAHPGDVLVPSHARRRGHPVVMPLGPFAGLVAARHPVRMRDWLRELTADGAARLLEVDVGDPGVIADYDDPASMR